jgi:hypothetical protein
MQTQGVVSNHLQSVKVALSRGVGALQFMQTQGVVSNHLQSVKVALSRGVCMDPPAGLQGTCAVS